jgi:hypothetical protein
MTNSFKEELTALMCPHKTTQTFWEKSLCPWPLLEQTKCISQMERISQQTNKHLALHYKNMLLNTNETTPTWLCWVSKKTSTVFHLELLVVSAVNRTHPMHPHTTGHLPHCLNLSIHWLIMHTKTRPKNNAVLILSVKLLSNKDQLARTSELLLSNQ